MSGDPALVVDLRVWRVPAVLPALARVPLTRRALRDVPGLRFARLLGTGAGLTFTPRDADLRQWALLTVTDGEHTAASIGHSRPVRSWDDAAQETLRVRMRPLGSRGRWAGREPFGAVERRPARHEGPVAAITRARLRTARTPSFWRALPPVVEALASAPGCRLAIGVGEAPVGLQGTFSLWSDDQALRDFAHHGAHRDVVRRTRPERWYAEELFARLAVLEVSGTHRGSTP